MSQCAHLFSRIDAIAAEYIPFLVDICRIESPSDYKEGVDRVARYFVEKAQARGWKTEVLEQPVASNAVCITLNPDAPGKPVVFSGHMDTVHPLPGLFGHPRRQLPQHPGMGLPPRPGPIRQVPGRRGLLSVKKPCVSFETHGFFMWSSPFSPRS